MEFELDDLDDIIDAHTERLMNDNDMTLAEARQSARKGAQRGKKYIEEVDELFERYF